MRDTAYIDSLYPQKGNYSFYLTQDDNVSGGQTDVVTYRTEDELPGVGRSSSDVKASIITVDNEPGLSVLANPDLSDPMDFSPSYKGWIARRTNQSTGNPRMFFKIDDRYFSGSSADATISVTYFDKGSDTFRIVGAQCRRRRGDDPNGGQDEQLSLEDCHHTGGGRLFLQYAQLGL